MTIYTADASSLAATLKKLAPGDILKLDDEFGDISLSKLTFDRPVTITGGPLRSLSASKCTGLIFDGLNIQFTPNETTLHFESAMKLYQSQKITVTGCTIRGGPAVNGVEPSATKLDATQNVRGLPCGRGITVDSCDNVSIHANEIMHLKTGIVTNRTANLVIADNSIHDLRTSPIVGVSSGGLTIEGNHCWNSTPWRFGGSGDHGDLIHIWTEAGQDGPTKGITIRDNFLAQGTGTAMLGIYLDDNTNERGFEDVDISNNVIANTNAQAIRLERVKGRVSNNTLMRTRDGDYHDDPGIIATSGSDVTLADNLLSRITVNPDSKAVQTGNQIVLRKDYGSVFANGLVSDPTLGDLALTADAKAGAVLARAGVPVIAVPEPPVADQEPVAPETIEITLQPGQRLVVTGAS